MSRPHLTSGGRYPVLRAMGILYVVGSFVVLAVGLYWTGVALFKAPGSMVERLALAGGAMAATFFAMVTVLAIAELIKLLIDIEHNTRHMAANGGVASSASATSAAGDGAPAGGRLGQMDEESAEAALIRGH